MQTAVHRSTSTSRARSSCRPRPQIASKLSEPGYDAGFLNARLHVLDEPETDDENARKHLIHQGFMALLDESEDSGSNSESGPAPPETSKWLGSGKEFVSKCKELRKVFRKFR
jgi:hypothetical protein